MQKFWKLITHLGGFPGGLLLALPYFFILTLEAMAGNLEQVVLLFPGFLLAFLLPLGLAALTKYFFFRPRPVPMERHHWRSKIMAGSFPSMHTITVMVYWILSFRFFPFFPFWLYGGIAVLVMISRILLKKHFWRDVFGGILYAFVGVFLAFWMFFSFLSLLSF